MNGVKLPPVMIEPQEAIVLFGYAKTEEMQRAKKLYEAYIEAKEVRCKPLWDLLDLWDLMSVLSFVYDTGRVQGIREERAKRT